MAHVNHLIGKFEQISRETTQIQVQPERVRVKKYSMPFHQSTLSFARNPVPASAPKQRYVSHTTPKQITPPAEDIDEDTIVVVLPDEPIIEDHERVPLLTPSESVTDASSQSSNTPRVKSRSKRVSSAQKSASEKTFLPPTSPSRPKTAPSEKLRNISGDTLVADASLSQTSLIKDGVEKLDLRWSMNLELGHVGKTQQSSDEAESRQDGETITVAAEEQETAEKVRKQPKHIKIEENSHKWEQRKKTADEKATRRSSRASILLSKATEVVSDITSSVLGKRPRDGKQEGDASKPAAVTPDIQPPAKKARFAIDAQKIEKIDDGVSLSITNRALRSRAPKDKKWLTSGLYAGQSRAFDPTKSESQNKRKSGGTIDPAPAPTKENTILPLPMFAGARLLDNGRDFRLPFDVFSPLPPGQPKPDEWRRVNKNVFVGDAAAEWRTNKFSEQSTCLCTPENGCDTDCMNRFMYYECDERNCNLASQQCGNRAFEGLRKRVKAGGQYNVGVEVLRTLDRGYGVRACRTFEPNQIIVEYTGEIINQEECESRMHGLYKDNECYYLMAFDQNMIIDATRGSIARFVNHSCDPNCRMEKWTVGGKPRMALFASDRGIMTGEELTYDYNFDPYSQKNVQVCRCGADNCRGVLGPKPKDLPKKEKESALAGAKRKLAEVIEEGKEMMTGNKKRKMEEKKLPKGWVYLEPEPKSKTTKPRKNSEDEEQIRSTDTDGTLARQPSKLKRTLSEKTKPGHGIKSINIKSAGKQVRKNARVVSTNSTGSGRALIAADDEYEQDEDEPTDKLSKSASKNSSTAKSSVAALKAKAETIKGKVGRSLRGR